MPFCVRTQFFERKLQKTSDFLISVKNCHDNWSKMAGFSKRSPSLCLCMTGDRAFPSIHQKGWNLNRIQCYWFQKYSIRLGRTWNHRMKSTCWKECRNACSWSFPSQRFPLSMSRKISPHQRTQDFTVRIAIQRASQSQSGTYCWSQKNIKLLYDRKKNPPKRVSFSDFICTFAMSFRVFVCLFLRHLDKWNFWYD